MNEQEESCDKRVCGDRATLLAQVWNVKMIFASLLNDDRNNNNTRTKGVYSRNSNETFLIAIITRTRAKKMSSNAVHA